MDSMKNNMIIETFIISPNESECIASHNVINSCDFDTRLELTF